MNSTVKKVSICNVLCLLVLTLCMLTVGAFAEDDSGEKTSVLEARNCLNSYIQNNYPEIEIDSKEYIDFLSDQLVFDKDINLLNQDNYQEMMAYASLYVINPDSYANKKARNKIEGKEIWSAYALVDEQEKAASDELSDTLATKQSFSSSKAISYAKKHARNPNTPAYPAYGSDCTNFVSQCIKAGGKSFTYAPSYKTKPDKYGTTKYWYSYHYTSSNPYHRYKQSTAFMRVSDFYTYWKNKGANIISCKNRTTLQDKAKLGDVVQLAKKNSSGKTVYYHTIIITGGKKGDWKYSARSNSAVDASISKIASTNTFRIIRIK